MSKQSAKSSFHSRSIFGFEFAHTPIFGLHIDQHGQSETEKHHGHSLTELHPAPWDESQPLSSPIRASSFESMYHSDSALLHNASIGIPTSYSSPDRHATRPLYPDLPSAYAQIQGRRATSLEPASSSRSGTRFPLSPSSSFSDHESFVPLSLNDTLPMRGISCRRVHSAHGVLHEADHHQESSAVFETSDESTQPKKRESRGSTILEDIVSQYADESPARPPQCDDVYETRTTIDLQTVALEQSSDRLINTDLVDPHIRPAGLGLDLYEFGQQTDKDAIVLPHRGHVTAEDEQEWETVPESGRSGFCTPSKLRFRLWKGETVNTSSSDLTGSTASPWDPLSRTAQSKSTRPRPRLCRPRHRQNSIPQCSLNRGRPEDIFLEYSNPFTRQKQSATTKGQVKRINERGNRSNFGRASVVKSFAQYQDSKLQPPDSTSSTRLTFRYPCEHFSTTSASQALPSSSLLPKALQTAFLASSPPTPAMTTQNQADQGAAGQAFLHLISDENSAANSFISTQRNWDALMSGALGEGDDVNNNYGDDELVVYEFSPFSSSSSSAGLTPHTSNRRRIAQRSIVLTAEELAEQNHVLSRQFSAGGYTLNDNDISRFLRDSRLRRHGLEKMENQLHNNNYRGQQGIRATGSSLANISSSPFTLTRFQTVSVASGGQDSDNEQIWTATPPTRQFSEFLNGTATTTTRIHGTEDSSLGSVHASTNSTSRSLMLEELEQNFSSPDPVLICDRCPTFPLSPEILGVLHLDGMYGTPFERLQIQNGEWLEKAWCFKHGRMEYSRAWMACNEARISADVRMVQRKAGALLLAFGTLAYLPGGWMLIRAMREGSDLATTAIAEVSRVLVGREAGVVCCVHPEDAAMAQAIEKVAFVVLGLGGFACVAALVVWAATHP